MILIEFLHHPLVKLIKKNFIKNLPSERGIMTPSSYSFSPSNTQGSANHIFICIVEGKDNSKDT